MERLGSSAIEISSRRGTIPPTRPRLVCGGSRSRRPTSNPVRLRDRAVLAVLVDTAARVGVGAKLTIKSLKHDGAQSTLRSSEETAPHDNAPRDAPRRVAGARGVPVRPGGYSAKPSPTDAAPAATGSSKGR